MVKKVGFSFTPGKVKPVEDMVLGLVTLPEDQHCLNCADPKTVLELVDGVCFDPCRYSRYLRKDGR